MLRPIFHRPSSVAWTQRRGWLGALLLTAAAWDVLWWAAPGTGPLPAPAMVLQQPAPWRPNGAFLVERWDGAARRSAGRAAADRFVRTLPVTLSPDEADGASPPRPAGAGRCPLSAALLARPASSGSREGADESRC